MRTILVALTLFRPRRAPGPPSARRTSPTTGCRCSSRTRSARAGSPPDAPCRAPAARTRRADHRHLARPVTDASGKSKLYLVRSYDIPSTDPSAARLANLILDVRLGDRRRRAPGRRRDRAGAPAARPARSRCSAPDWLARPRPTTPSTRVRVQVFRSGTIAWVGYARAAARASAPAREPLQLAASRGTAQWLLAQHGSSGLLTGGPDVTWVSRAQHSPTVRSDARSALVSPSSQMSPANRIAAGIDANLTITPAPGSSGFSKAPTTRCARSTRKRSASSICFRAPATPTRSVPRVHRVDDVHALRPQLAKSPRRRRTGTLPPPARSPANRPYAASAPDVIWSEGTAQVTWVTGLLGIVNTHRADRDSRRWRNVTIGEGEGPAAGATRP